MVECETSQVLGSVCRLRNLHLYFRDEYIDSEKGRQENYEYCSILVENVRIDRTISIRAMIITFYI